MKNTVFSKYGISSQYMKQSKIIAPINVGVDPKYFVPCEFQLGNFLLMATISCLGLPTDIIFKAVSRKQNDYI